EQVGHVRRARRTGPGAGRRHVPRFGLSPAVRRRDLVRMKRLPVLIVLLALAATACSVSTPRHESSSVRGQRLSAAGTASYAGATAQSRGSADAPVSSATVGDSQPAAVGSIVGRDSRAGPSGTE